MKTNKGVKESDRKKNNGGKERMDAMVGTKKKEEKAKGMEGKEKGREEKKEKRKK